MNERINELYDKRFQNEERKRRNALWKILCSAFFQKYIPPESCLLDVGAGFCEFINNISCKTKYAIDLNPKMPTYANPNIQTIIGRLTDLTHKFSEFFDVIFMSNFLEHLLSKDEVLQTISEAFQLQKINGRILILQPNIRYLGGEYWDFFDHHIPLSERSLIEALRLSGYKIDLVIPKFLPYTTLSRYPKNPQIVKVYLTMPILWKIFGKQSFIIGKKNGISD